MSKYARQPESGEIQKISSGKKIIKLGINAGFVCLMTFAGLSGCSCSQKPQADDADTAKKEEAKGTTSTNTTDKGETVTLEPVSANAKEVCTDEKLQSSLKETLKNSLSQQSKMLGAESSQNNGVKLDVTQLSKKSDNVIIDVQNIQPAKGAAESSGVVTCQASVSMTLPTQDINSASKLYSATNKQSLEQKFAQSNISLNNNMIVDNQFTFAVNPQSASLEAKLVGQPPMLQAVADVVASSAVKAKIDANQAAAAKRRQQQRAAEKKRKEREAAKRYEKQRAEKKRREQQEAKRREQQRIKKQEAKRRAEQRAKEQAVKPNEQQNYSLETDGQPLNQTNQSNTDTAKPKQPKAATAIKDADNIEMVIVEEEGTY